MAPGPELTPNLRYLSKRVGKLEKINKKQIKLIITVDNGISAFDAINRSNELGIDLIITDHHKIPNRNILKIFW